MPGVQKTWELHESAVPLLGMFHVALTAHTSIYDKEHSYILGPLMRCVAPSSLVHRNRSCPLADI